MKYKALLTILTATVLLQGCINYSDGGGFPRGHYKEPTVGQELMDLDKARVSGAITGAEYERLKAKIIDEQE